MFVQKSREIAGKHETADYNLPSAIMVSAISSYALEHNKESGITTHGPRLVIETKSGHVIVWHYQSAILAEIDCLIFDLLTGQINHDSFEKSYLIVPSRKEAIAVLHKCKLLLNQDDKRFFGSIYQFTDWCRSIIDAEDYEPTRQPDQTTDPLSGV